METFFSFYFYSWNFSNVVFWNIFSDMSFFPFQVFNYVMRPICFDIDLYLLESLFWFFKMSLCFILNYFYNKLFSSYLILSILLKTHWRHILSMRSCFFSNSFKGLFKTIFHVSAEIPHSLSYSSYASFTLYTSSLELL